MGMGLLQCYLIALAAFTIGAVSGIVGIWLLVHHYLRLCVSQRCLVLDDVEYTLDDADYWMYRHRQQEGAGENG